MKSTVAIALILFGAGAQGAGFSDRYTATTGDLNNDGRTDIYLEFTPQFVFVDVGDIPTPIATSRREVGEFVLRNVGDGTFVVVDSLTTTELAAVRSWPSSNIRVIVRDINADGFADIALGDIDEAIVQPPAIHDYIIYAPILANTPPSILREVDDYLIQFGQELMAWTADPSYFVNTAPVHQASQTAWWRLSSLIAAHVTFGGLSILDDPLDSGTLPDVCLPYPENCDFGPLGWVIYATITWNYKDYSQFSLALLLADYFGADSEIVYQDANGIAPAAADVVSIMDYMLGTRYTRTQVALPQIAIPVPVPPPPPPSGARGGTRADDEEQLGYLVLSAIIAIARTVVDLVTPDEDPRFFHYTDDGGCTGIAATGRIVSSSQQVFLTPHLFQSAPLAKKYLALSGMPACFFVVMGSWAPNLVGPGIAGQNNGEPGGAIQWVSTGPIILPGPFRAPMRFPDGFGN